MKWYLAITCVITLSCAFYLAHLGEAVSVIQLCAALTLINYTVHIFLEDRRKSKGGWT